MEVDTEVSHSSVALLLLGRIWALVLWYYGMLCSD